MKKRFLSLLLCLTLLVGLLPAGMLVVSAADAEDAAATGAEADAAATGDYDYTYTVTTITDLMQTFNVSRPKGTSVLIKLGADISYTGSNAIVMRTDGPNITLDLCGYLLKCVDKSNHSYQLLRGEKGSVTIMDSRRYNSSINDYVNGRIVYQYTLPDRSTSILAGNIIVKSGYFINNTHSNGKDINSVYSGYRKATGASSQTTYSGGRLRMEGGCFMADCPIELAYDTDCEISGGELDVLLNTGIRIAIGHSYQSNFTSDNVPKISSCCFKNLSDNTKVNAFDVKMPSGYFDTHTPDEARSAFHSAFPEGTVAYTQNWDGPEYTRLARVTEGIQCLEDQITGPQFESSYTITTPNIISSVALTIPALSPGELMSYNAYVPSRKGYQVCNFSRDNIWKNGIEWTDYNNYTSPYEVGSRYEGGKSYTVFIMVEPYSINYAFTDVDSISITINGKQALVYKSDTGAYVAYRSFTCPDKATIGSVALTIPAPKEGQALPYNATAPGSADYEIQSVNDTIYHGGVRWSVNSTDLTYGTVAEAGKTYRVSIRVKPKNTLAYRLADADDLDATVNGKAAGAIDISAYSDGTYIIYLDFFVPHLITELNLSVVAPRAGEKLPYAASAPGSAAYTVKPGMTHPAWKNGVMWSRGEPFTSGFVTVYPDDVYYATAGGPHTVWISVVPKDTANYAFDDVANMTAKVNGKAATVYRIGENNYGVYYSFDVSGVIRRIDVTVPEPVAGELPSYDAAVLADNVCSLYTEEDDGYHEKNGTMWEYYSGENLYVLPHNQSIQAGVRYMVSVSVATASPYTFAAADSLYTYVNGKKANVRRINDTWCVVEYTFTAQEAPVIFTVGDVDSSGEVTNRDAVILDRYIAGWLGYDKQIKNMDAADLDRKDGVTNRDAIILDRYIAGWTGYGDYIITVVG